MATASSKTGTCEQIHRGSFNLKRLQMTEPWTTINGPTVDAETLTGDDDKDLVKGSDP